MINLIGIVYEVDTINELNTMPSYIPPNSKSYYFCKENNILYERGFSGGYIETKDFDNIIKSKKVEDKQLENKKNLPQEKVTDMTNNNEINEGNNNMDYLYKCILHVNYKINEIIKLFNPNMLPDDIYTKYNPDIKEEGVKNVE